MMPGSRGRQGGRYHGGGLDRGFHGGLVVAVATAAMETVVAMAASCGNGGMQS
jgi:hypothetical protein